MRAEIRKPQTEASLINWVDYVKNSGCLNSRMTTAEDRSSELEDELQKVTAARGGGKGSGREGNHGVNSRGAA